jgi:hypothetical protein
MAKRLWSYGKNRTDFYELANELKSQTEWEMGKLRGTNQFNSYGRLPVEYQDSAAYAVYAVMSYDTPIAWIDARTGQWVMPQVHYSLTTTKHQGRINVALAVLRGEF